MSEQVANETLLALEERLRRLELLLRGDPSLELASALPINEQQNKPARIRMQKLERRFSDLCQHSKAVDNVLKLRKCALLDPALPTPAPTGPPTDTRVHDFSRGHAERHADEAMSTADKLSIVLASSDMIAATVSRLNTFESSQLPDNGPLGAMLALQPRLQHAQMVQEAQAAEMAALRQRTTHVLGKWYESSVIEEGEQWVAWEQRLSQIEQHVRRQEHRHDHEAHAI